jgi:hypothetical protein
MKLYHNTAISAAGIIASRTKAKAQHDRQGNDASYSCANRSQLVDHSLGSLRIALRIAGIKITMIECARVLAVAVGNTLRRTATG